MEMEAWSEEDYIGWMSVSVAAVSVFVYVCIN